MKRSQEAVKAEFNSLPDNVVTALAFIEMSGESRAMQLLNRYESRLARRFHQIQCELRAFAIARKGEQKEEPAAASRSGAKKYQTNLRVTPVPDPSRVPSGPATTKRRPCPSERRRIGKMSPETM
jgi:hypothetical protein